MKRTEKERFAEFLTTSPLYKKESFDLRFIQAPTDINDLTFSFSCPIDKGYQTFKIRAEPSSFPSGNFQKFIERNPIGGYISDDEKDLRFNFVQQYSATCQYCNRYQAHFLIRVETDGPVPLNPGAGQDKHQVPKQSVTKVGQLPPYEIKPDSKLITFLSREDKENYKKSLICLSHNYGVAAFAYLRRIVENEMVQIVESLSKLDRPESSSINALLAKFRENPVKSDLIDGVFDYLPTSLKELGDNPLKLLYKQLSGGIHEFSEEECFEKASQINKLLKFVIQKINEDTSIVKDAKDAIKALR